MDAATPEISQTTTSTKIHPVDILALRLEAAVKEVKALTLNDEISEDSDEDRTDDYSAEDSDEDRTDDYSAEDSDEDSDDIITFGVATRGYTDDEVDELLSNDEDDFETFE